MIMRSVKLILVSVFFSIALTPQVSAFKQEDLNKLISTKQCPKCDLEGANLNNADLKGSNLIDANLDRTDLMKTNLS
jgi:uncharacterized protein YjbI with pentapeptide repeats